MQLGGGYQWQRDKKYLPYVSLGFQYTRIFPAKIQGSITQFSIPEFNNYNYQFSYDADLYTLKGKFDLIEFHSFLPYWRWALVLPVIILAVIMNMQNLRLRRAFHLIIQLKIILIFFIRWVLELITNCQIYFGLR